MHSTDNFQEVFAAEFRKLATQGLIPAEEAELPDLGEIPEADPLPDDEEEEEEEEDDEDDDSEDEGRRRKKPGPKPGFKRGLTQKHEPDLRKKRGRPPRVDTPMEIRIKTILKGIRKFKGAGGHLKITHFERLPDKAAYPDYYMEIKEPIAIDIIKRKSKRKKYNSVDHFMRDLDLMFENAKAYNQSDSQIFKDAVDLQTESRKLAEQEKKKPDSEFLMEDGRFPLPDGILHRGELWKVGDWVHIQNQNDVSKPIVAQIYRTWQDSDGEKWINACWYYRPEQTVHHFEKHFYPNEVVKTGQYRDHRIDEIVDRCFVMFFTRYSRGRPRDLAPDKEIYVCEARYNEEKHKLNKIKTWASCLPDEVREKDYEMDLFDVPRKIKKIPSPIKHLLKEDAKETDDLPRPTWGTDNAPPVAGAVHRRPRDENVSLHFHMRKDHRKLTTVGIPTTRANPIPASSLLTPVRSTPSTTSQNDHRPRRSCSSNAPNHHTHYSRPHPPTRLPPNDPISILYGNPPTPRKQPCRRPANTSRRIPALTTSPAILSGPTNPLRRLPPKPHASPTNRVQPQRTAARGSLPPERRSQRRHPRRHPRPIPLR